MTSVRCICNHAYRTHSLDASGNRWCRGKECLCPNFDAGDSLDKDPFITRIEDLIRVGAIKKIRPTGTVRGA